MPGTSSPPVVSLWEAVQELLYEVQTCDSLAGRNGGHPEGEEFVGSYTIASGRWHALLRAYQNVQDAGVKHVRPAMAAQARGEWSTTPLRTIAGWIESALWLVEHYASEAADRVNQWRTS